MLVNLNSVGTAINISTKITYPIYADGTIDLDDDGVHLSECSDEWYSALSEVDKSIVNKL